MLVDIREKILRHENQIRFINEVLNDTIDFRKMTKNDVMEYFSNSGYHSGNKNSNELTRTHLITHHPQTAHLSSFLAHHKISLITRFSERKRKRRHHGR